MKKYFKEIIILLMQLLLFYILPLFAGPTDMIGLVFLIIFLTFILGLLFGVLSNENKKYLYPIIVFLIFIPSVFIYYNESALVHSLWYLIDSSLGLLIGAFLKRVFKI